MLRILRAFVWLRWRTLVNALEGTGSRDVLTRLSVATDGLGPVLMLVVLLPSALALAGLAGVAGWGLTAVEGPGAAFATTRIVLGVACILTLAAPLVLPSGERTHAARLLLLPISRGVLYVAHAIGTAAHPLLLLVAAMVVALPIGLAGAGHPLAAVIAIVAGGLLFAALAGLLVAVTAGAQLLLQDRRRGEWVALGLFLLFPIVGVMAGMLDGQGGSRHTPRAERQLPPPTTIDRRALAILPSEPYVHAVRTAAEARYTAAVRPLLILAATAGLVHAVAAVVFGRLLGSAGGGAGPRRSPRSSARWRRLPGLSAGVSAVALNQVRLALRTPRGRFTILSPIVIFVPLAVMLIRSTSGVDLPFLRVQGGIGLAVFTSFLSLLAVLPLAMNQFAVDRSGLTLAFLLPLETRTLLLGKAAGNGVVAAMPAAFCIAAAAALFPGGDPAIWACVPLALLATYLLTAPAAVALSAMLPRSVDLNSIGHGSNAHGAASLLGTAALAAAGASCLLPVRIATGLLNDPRLAPLFLLMWVVCAASWCALLLRPLSALVDQRRETFAMMR